MQVDNVDARVVVNGRPAPPEMEFEARLQAGLRADGEGDGLMVTVTPGCGEAEVRIAGPKAALILFFDRAELWTPAVRSAVRAGVARYASSLGHQRRREHDDKSKRRRSNAARHSCP